MKISVKKVTCRLRANGKTEGTSLPWCELTSSPGATSCTTPVRGAQSEPRSHPILTVPREVPPQVMVPGSLKTCSSTHSPIFLPLLYSTVQLLYKRSLFWFGDMYSHKMTGNVWTTSSRKCCLVL